MRSRNFTYIVNYISTFVGYVEQLGGVQLLTIEILHLLTLIGNNLGGNGRVGLL